MVFKQIMNGYLVKCNASYGCNCTKYICCVCLGVCVFLYSQFFVNHMLWELGYSEEMFRIGTQFCLFRIGTIFLYFFSSLCEWFSFCFFTSSSSFVCYFKDRQMTFISNSVCVYVWMCFCFSCLIFVII